MEDEVEGRGNIPTFNWPKIARALLLLSSSFLLQKMTHIPSLICFLCNQTLAQ